MKELFNGIYEYQTEHAIFELSNFSSTRMSATEKAVCHLRIFQDKTKTFVIVTELVTNPGMSVTNAAEVIASKVVNQFHLNPETTRFIEHYGQESYEYTGGRKRVDVFDDVTFTWNGTNASSPKWKPANGTEIQKILKSNKRKKVN